MKILDIIADRLCCPDCHSTVTILNGGSLVCDLCGVSYPVVRDKPVLFKISNQLFKSSDYVNAPPKTYQRTSLSSYFPKITADLAVERTVARLAAQLDLCGPSKVVIVGGGCQREWLTPIICANVDHVVIYTDVDTAADVDIFCDAQDLPFATGSIDAVITTAVLEHVMYPEKAAKEIFRVLKTDGLLYSEIPFMQQVHEGAYDFTRYTLSGHRRLFIGFREIDAGMTAGPGSALAWSIESFVRSFFVSSRMRMVVTGISRLFWGWLKYLDPYFATKDAAMDGACGTYFFGTKSEIERTDDEIITAYIGSRHLAHR